MVRVSHCKSCEAPIHWLTKTTSSGKFVRVAVDIEPVYGGTIVLDYPHPQVFAESPPVDNQLRYRRHKCNSG